MANKPIKTFRAGCVKAAIFENQTTYNGKQSTIYRIAIDKSYKDSNGVWKSTSSFNASTELPKAILVLQKAFDYCMSIKKKTSDNGNSTTNMTSEEYIEGYIE